MEYTNLNIRTSKETKAAAEKIFDELGINTSTAFNIFLKAVIRENGLPFDMRVESPNAETIAAIEEGRRIARDPNVKGYSSIEELKAALGL
ncbi:MAG: type II toxin-antitoxin system RelB/DinJ family antitoxin [Clostridia bacterium]|nr:type II toxin-antitoxin system RelB/DinJ family antitoxin [Clostridia bacterium]